VRWLKRILVLLLILALGVTAFAVYTVRRSFPQVSGELSVTGLQDRVEVFRDRLGVPHIYASNQHDLFFAQGYTHAQDRFWQMDFWRHIGSARLSEMFGESQVETDMFLRSLGWEALAEQEWETLGSSTRQVLQSYADGVNAYLETHAGSGISLEYAILPLQNPDYEIEPWSPINTLTWVKLMSWDLGGNMEDEIARAVLGKTLPPERVEQLYPPFGEDKPVIVEDGTATASLHSPTPLPDGAVAAIEAGAAGAELVNDLTGGGFEGIGSNNWALSGSMTGSGLPLLANDTHLAIQMPSIWYGIGLHCTGDGVECPYQVVGFSFAGAPGVVIGHNEHHAWGVTNAAADTQDLFIERVNPANPDQYEVNGEWIDFEERSELIEVAGAEENVTFTVRSTRHGPVISGTFLEDQLEASSSVQVPEEYVVSLAWRTLQPSFVVEAVLGINRATSYEEFREALRSWDIAPQNVVYADVEGNIAYHLTGEIPIRASGDGRYPAPGWDSSHDWTSFIPVDSLPSLLNPESGFIVTANQPVLRPGSEPMIGTDAAAGYRAGRIEELLQAVPAHDVETTQRIQFDSFDGGAEVVVPHLLALDGMDDPVLADLLVRLEGWATGQETLQTRANSVGAGIYQAVWRHLLDLTFRDELPEEQRPSGGARWFEVVRGLLEEPEDPFWDDITTPELETRDDILVSALEEAEAELNALLGDDPDDWAWGRLHTAEFENQTFGQSGIAPIEWLFNRSAPEIVGGSESVVNAVGWDTRESYQVDWLPSERMVIDLADLGASTFAHTTGQSGHAFHQNYASMIEMWARGEQAPMPWTRDQVEAVTTDTLVMLPLG
jgi:penicillin amidase